MELTNYQDRSKGGIGTNAGFQFEFYCANCSRRWNSPFKPYRRGQLTGWFYKFGYIFAGTARVTRLSSALSQSGEQAAREAALQEALALAEPRYFECRSCVRTVCEECWDDRAGSCIACIGEGRRHADDDGEHGGRSVVPAESPRSRRVVEENVAVSAGPACPNCQTALGGGRFCAECGFDMASTHKSCPGCGAMCARSTRFCAECGHGF